MSWVNGRGLPHGRALDAAKAEELLKRLPSLPIRLVLPGEADIVPAAQRATSGLPRTDSWRHWRSASLANTTPFRHEWFIEAYRQPDHGSSTLRNRAFSISLAGD
jgi:hypothetical protein